MVVNDITKIVVVVNVCVAADVVVVDNIFVVHQKKSYFSDMVVVVELRGSW